MPGARRRLECNHTELGRKGAASPLSEFPLFFRFLTHTQTCDTKPPLWCEVACFGLSFCFFHPSRSTAGEHILFPATRKQSDQKFILLVDHLYRLRAGPRLDTFALTLLLSDLIYPSDSYDRLWKLGGLRIGHDDYERRSDLRRCLDLLIISHRRLDVVSGLRLFSLLLLIGDCSRLLDLPLSPFSVIEDRQRQHVSVTGKDISQRLAHPFGWNFYLLRRRTRRGGH